ncbi:MAG: acyltransferase [Firmicutes bacterium]|nr:acyltransferase [Bacillota bacterium]
MLEQGRRNRIPVYEWMRVIAMGMVLCLHANYQLGALADAGSPLTPTRVLGGFLESFAIIAVNVYVLISGYFLSKIPFRLSRLLRLWCEILFYAALIPVVLRAFGVPISGTNIWSAAAYVLPVSMNHYWFATSYVWLVLLSPVLNAAAERLSRRQLKAVLLGLLFVESFLPSISPVQLVSDNFGYDFSWFLVLYLTAAYLRRYGAGRFERGKRALLAYLGSCLGIFALYVGLHLVYERTGSLAWYMQVPFHYNFVLTYLASVGFFAAFRRAKIPEGRASDFVMALAPETFGVYLIHQHVDVKDRWAGVLQRFLGEVSQTNPLRYLLEMLAAVVILYAVCAAIDWVRNKLFRAAKRALSKTRPAAWIRRADAVFAERGDKEESR